MKTRLGFSVAWLFDNACTVWGCKRKVVAHVGRLPVCCVHHMRVAMGER